MNIRISECQHFFESMFTGPNGIPFQNVKKTEYLNRNITSFEIRQFKNLSKKDIFPFYYKALISFLDGVHGITKRLYSWTTIKMYYTVYYAIRASLLCNDIILLRTGRDLYYLNCRQRAHFVKCEDKTDHKGSMITFKHFFSSRDFLLSNFIENSTTYEWMMKCREEVNYKDLDFHEPFSSSFWISIDNFIKHDSLKNLFCYIYDEKETLAFQTEFAILTIPLLRLIYTYKDIINANIDTKLDEPQKKFINNISKNIPTEIFRLFVNTD